jgi:hypothetical protein
MTASYVKIKTYIDPYKLVLIICLAFIAGCEGSCKVDADIYRPKQCAILVADTWFNGRWFRLEGTNIETGKLATYSDQGGWYLYFKDYIALGDTVIKRKNELVFYIHKKDTTLVFPLECQGKIYH